MPQKTIIQQNKCDGSGWTTPSNIYNNLYGTINWNNACTSELTPFNVLKEYAAGLPNTSPLADGSAKLPYGNVNKLLSDNTLVFVNTPGDKKNVRITQKLAAYMRQFKKSKIKVESSTGVGNPAPNNFVLYKGKKYTSIEPLFSAANSTGHLLNDDASDFLLDGDITFFTYASDIIKYKFRIPPGVMTKVKCTSEGFIVNLTFNLYLVFNGDLTIEPRCTKNNATYNPIIVPIIDNDQNFCTIKLARIIIPYTLRMNKRVMLEQNINGDYDNTTTDGGILSEDLIVLAQQGSERAVETINVDHFDLYTTAFEGADPKVQIDDPFGPISSDHTTAVKNTLSKILNDRITELFNNEQRKSLGDQLKKYGLSVNDTSCITGCIKNIRINNLEYRVCCETFDTRAGELSQKELEDPNTMIEILK